MEISVENAESSDLPKNPRPLDLQSIYVKKSRSSDRKSWARKQDSGSQEESKVLKKKLGSPFEEGSKILLELNRKPSRKEVSLSSLEPVYKKRSNGSNVSRPKHNFISLIQKKDTTTSESDASQNLDRSNGNTKYLGNDLHSLLLKKTDHASPSDAASINKSYMGEDFIIPKWPRGISKWKITKGSASSIIPTNNFSHGKISNDAQDNKLSISGNLNLQVLDDKKKKKSDELELNGFHKDDSAPCTSVKNDSHIKGNNRKVRSKKQSRMSEQSCLQTDTTLVDESRDSPDDDDEGYLEENAARMLSLRFDPNCTVFSGKRSVCTAEPVEGSSFLHANHGTLEVSQAEACTLNARARVLWPRRHNGKSFARKRRHFYEVCSRNIDPYCVIKQRIGVYWPLDKNWYFGLVKGYNPASKLHYVKYDDRDEEWINLQEERVKLLLFPSEVSRKFSFGKPRSELRQTNAEEVAEARDSSCTGSLLESEPIISWLTRTTCRVTSSSSSIIKKHLRVSPLKAMELSVLLEPKENISVNLSDENPNNCNESQLPCHQSIKRVSELKRSIDSIDKKLPFVYFRKRFRSKKEVMDSKLVQDVAPEGRGCPTNILALIANSTTAKEELNTMMTLMGLKQGTFELSLPPKSSLELAFQSEIFWLYQFLSVLHHGKIVSAWPVVHMEIFFIDNALRLRFMLFEGCLKRAVSLFCNIITTVNGHIVKSSFTGSKMTCTSIGLRISGLHNQGVKVLFVINTFSKMESSKWRYLEDKLKKQCTKEALTTAEYMCSNIHNFPSCQILCSFVKPLETFWGRPSFFHRLNPEKLVDPKTNAVIHYLAQEHGKLPQCSLFIVVGPSFSIILHLKLLIEKDATSLCFDEHILKHADNNDKLAADGCFSFEDPSELDPEKLDNSGPCLSQAKASHGRPSVDALSAGSNGDLSRSTKNFLSSEVNVIQNAAGDGGDLGKSTSDEGVIQFGRTSYEAGTSKSVEDSCSERPECSSFPGKSLDGGCSFSVSATNLNAQPLDQVEKHSLHKGVLITRYSFNLVLEMNEHSIQSPTAPRSIWHRSRRTSLPRTFIHHSKLGSEGFMVNGSTIRHKRHRTQVSNPLLTGGYEHAAKSRSNNLKVQPHKKVKNDIANVSSNCPRSPQSNLDLFACDANVLVTHGDKCVRDFGAKVQLACDDQKNWVICIKVSGATKYVYRADHVLQPGTTNRYTHAMMWRGGKEWMLEFTNRNQWYLFKQMHEECYNRIIRAASIKNIPIPGVRLLSDSDDGYGVPFVRSSSKYFHQIGTEVDLALDPSCVLYDMDCEDEEWMSTIIVNMDARGIKMSEVTEEIFERVMDMFEKLAYTQQCEEFTDDDIEKYMANVGPANLIRAIYEHWRQKRKRKGLPLIRQFQPPLWEHYQQQIKEWESNMKKMPSQPEGCKDIAYSLKKPPMFAFCLRPQDLEIPNKGSKQRSHKKLVFNGHHNALIREQDGFHTFGRKMDGNSLGEVAVSSYESSDSFHRMSRSTISPRDTASSEFLFTNDDYERYTDPPKLYKSMSRKVDIFLSPRDPRGTPLSCNQRSNRNGINRWSSEFCKWPGIKQSQSTRFQRHHADMDEIRLCDATSVAQHALNMAKLKREKAQWLLHKADLALHRATVVLMIADAIEVSEKDIVANG